MQIENQTTLPVMSFIDRKKYDKRKATVLFAISILISCNYTGTHHVIHNQFKISR